MTEKDMEKMDREVMEMVNSRNEQAEQETCSSCPPAENPTGESNAAQHVEEPENEGLETQLQEKDGMYCISKKALDALEVKARKHRKAKSVGSIAACVVIIGTLYVAFSRPDLLNYIVSAGVVGCSVMIGVCLERLAEAK